MGRVMGMYRRIGYEDEECKTCPHSALLPCLPLDVGLGFFPTLYDKI